MQLNAGVFRPYHRLRDRYNFAARHATVRLLT
jgi:hypothetical protein